MAEEVRVQQGQPGPVPDVLIIGAGASGAVVAWSLAEAGLRVVCLEQGDWVDPRSYAHWGPDWERRRQTDWAKDPNVRARPEDYPLDNRDTPITPLMFNAVGGSTIHWSGHFPRFRPSDFRVRTLDGVADDWPLSYWDLAPYYDQNDAFIGVSGLHGDPAYPPRPPRHGPPQGLGPAGEAYVRGLERLGWHWWPSDSALLSAPLGGPPGQGAPGGPPGRGAPSATPAAPATWAAPPGPCPAPTSPTGRRRSPRERSCAPGPGCGRSLWIARGGPRGPSTTTPRGGCRSNGRAWWCWPGTASAPPACCSTPSPGASPAVWRTPAGRWGAT